jgi:superfamily II DNA or RNA helicase
MILRPYQQDVIAEFQLMRMAGHRRILLCAPTGSGKTIIGCEIIKQELRSGVLVVSHRREIIAQTSEKLFRFGIGHGIIQAGFSPRPLERVQVASIQTLHRRAVTDTKINFPPAKLLWIDEAHHCPAETYKNIIAEYPNATLLGTTATPCRGDGRGLGSIFEIIIECPQVPELIKQGYLVGTRVYAPIDPDLKGVRTVAGDYNEAQLAERMDRDELVGDICTHWHRYGEKRKTVCFAVSVEHSVHIRDEFIKSGVRAEHIDAMTPKAERESTLARLAVGEIDLVTNCMVLTEGFDCPPTGCIILARPTKRMGLFRQMIGRALRPADGKPDAIVLDHSGAVFRHGFVEDPVEWTLSPDKKAVAPKHVARSQHAGSRLVECKNCGVIRTGGGPCWNCGFMPAPPPRRVDFVDGDLGLVDGSRRANGKNYTPEERERWWRMLTAIGIERGYKPNWAAVNFKEKFGHWPGRYGATTTPIPPSPEVRSWVRSRMIAYAKRRSA